MRSSVQLWDLYQQWKGLTQKEGDAILSSNWREVRRCQNAKQELQPKIIQLTESAKAEFGTGDQQREFDDRLRGCVNELILLETQNSSALGERLDALGLERAELEKSSKQLRQLHKSYLPTQNPTWNNYS
jgi:hypothetical protein